MNFTIANIELTPAIELAKSSEVFPCAVGRSSTGMFHQIKRSPRVVNSSCNHGRITLGLSVRISADWLTADEAMFCKKCFPKGKAAALRIANLQMLPA
jgi:hypothetical protein